MKVINNDVKQSSKQETIQIPHVSIRGSIHLHLFCPHSAMKCFLLMKYAQFLLFFSTKNKSNRVCKDISSKYTKCFSTHK